MADKKKRPEDEIEEEELEEEGAEEEEEFDFDSLPVIDIANDENDDWIKKANPQAAREEIEIHEALEKRYREEAAAKRKGGAKAEAAEPETKPTEKKIKARVRR